MTRTAAILLAAGLASVTPTAAQSVSRTPVTMVSMSHAAGLLASGEQMARRTLQVDAEGDLTLVVASPTRLSVELATPDGRRVAAGTSDGDDTRVFEFALEEPPSLPLPGVGRGQNTLIMLRHAAAGSYDVQLRAERPVEQATAFVLTLLPTSELRLGLALPESELPIGQGVAIAGILFEGERAVADAKVIATITREPGTKDDRMPVAEQIELRDDGRGADAAAGDGIFTGLYVPEIPGQYVVLARAEGLSSEGRAFERDTAGGFLAAERAAALGEKYEFEAIDDDHDERYDRLQVRSEVSAPAPGRYDVTVTLRASNDATVSAHTLVMLDGGTQPVAVDFDAALIRTLGADGPWTLALVRLDEVTGSDRLLRDRSLEAGATDAFTLGSFAQ
jgi:hypothetical protein